MAYRVDVTIEYSREDIRDSVTGNGSLAYEWWNELEFHPDDSDALVTGEFGCLDEDTTSPFRVTYEQWVKAAGEVARKHTHWGQFILEKDIDADCGDLIMQYAVAGKGIYG